MKKKIGILGGMGPKATVYFFDRIVELTGANSDAGHIPVVILNNPQIPDRTEAILHNGPSPLPLLAEGAKFLEKSGCDFIVMPCVTAHYYYNDIVKNIDIPFLHLIEETNRFLENKMPGLRKTGLLATTGTIAARIFQERLEAAGLETVIPTGKSQENIMAAIYGKEGIKAGFFDQPKDILLQEVSRLRAAGAEAVIAGCTELPLVLASAELSIPLVEPLEILAGRAVEEAAFHVGRE